MYCRITDSYGTPPGYPGDFFLTGSPRPSRLVPSLSLTTCQRDLYRSRLVVWRPSQTIAATGKPGAITYAVVYVSVPCYIQSGPSQQTPQAGIGLVAEGDMIFTYDQFHLPTGVTLLTGDVIIVVSGSYAGDFYTIRGEGQRRLELAERVLYYASRLPTLPNGVAA